MCGFGAFYSICAVLRYPHGNFPLQKIKQLVCSHVNEGSKKKGAGRMEQFNAF